MPKKRKCKLKTLPTRHCKKPKTTLSLREKKKLVNYDDSKYDCWEYMDDCDTIEISSEDSRNKKCTENSSLNNDTGDNSSDVIIIENSTEEAFKAPLFESMDIIFEDQNLADTININSVENNTKENSTGKKRFLKKKAKRNPINTVISLLNNSSNSPISLSSSETKSSKSESENSVSKKHRKNKSVIPPVAEEIFYVEKILDMKIVDGKKLFLLKWEGFSDSENTWEPEENIQTNIMVQEFLSKCEDLQANNSENSLSGPEKETMVPIEHEGDNRSEQKNDNIHHPMEFEKDNDIIDDQYSGDNNTNKVEEYSEKHDENQLDLDVKQNNDSPRSDLEVISVDTNDILDNGSVLNTFENSNNLEDKPDVKIQDNNLEKQNPNFHGDNIFNICAELHTLEKLQNSTVTVKDDGIDNQILQDEDPNDISDHETKIYQEPDKQETEQSDIHDPVAVEQLVNKKNMKKTKYAYGRKRKYKYKKQTFKSHKRAKTENNNNRPRRSKSLREILATGNSSPMSESVSKDLDKPRLVDNFNQHDIESSGQTLQETWSQNSKDPNIFFPGNMPQSVQEIFMVEKILKMKIVNGVRKFFLKWEGFPDSENTWEPEENLECPELIKEFLEQRKKIKRMKKKKKLSAEESVSLDELPEDVLIKEPVVRPRGFPRSREAECVLAAGMMNDQLMFLIKWKNIDMANLVSARRANLECPQVVIRYYEERLNWKNGDDTITHKPKENINDVEEFTPVRQSKPSANNQKKDMVKSVSCLISLLNSESENSTSILDFAKPTTKPKVQISAQSKPKVPRPVHRKVDKHVIPDYNLIRPCTGSSSSSMMSLIKNFKDKKPEVPYKLPTVNVPVVSKPLGNSLERIESREYDSRGIPQELSPPKIEIPKINPMPMLRTINSYRGDLNPRRFALSSRSAMNVSHGNVMQFPNPLTSSIAPGNTPQNPSSYNNSQLNMGSSLNMSQKITIPKLVPTSSLPNTQMLNSSLVNQLPAFNSISSNINVDDSLSNPQIMINHYPQGTDSFSVNLPVRTNVSTISNYATGPPTALIEYLPNHQSLGDHTQSINNTNYENSINQMMSMTAAIDPHIDTKNRSTFSQSDTMLVNLMNNYNDSQPLIDTRNATRFQLAAALQSRYQKNPMILMHSNPISSGGNMNQPVLLYPNQIQHSVPHYQYVINQPNYNANTATIQQQQQAFYSQQQQQQQPLMTPSTLQSNNCLILPKMENYAIQNEVNQHLFQQSQPQFQQFQNQTPMGIQNTYLNLRAFL